MFQCCSPLPRPAGKADPCAGAASDPPEPVLWLADSWLQKVRAGSELLAVGAKDKGPVGPVQLLQRALRSWGCRERREPIRLLPKFGLDGSFDKETADAVTLFQTENSDVNGNPLVADGVVGRLTMAALDRIVLPPIAPPADEMIPVKVDFVVFPDGLSALRIPRILREANYVFNRAGIRIDLGSVWGPEKTGPAACTIFEKNLGSPHEGWCRSNVTADTTMSVTPELHRLAAFRPGSANRVTFYFVGTFPGNRGSSWGATFTPAYSETPFTSLITNWTADPVDICWHELGHCLLNTAYGEIVDGKGDDHDHPIMGVNPRPGLGKASLPISGPVIRRMQQTALLDLA
jgi:hypothetical protein